MAHEVRFVSQFLSNPGKEYWAIEKLILRYLRVIYRECLCFSNGEPMLDGYTNANMTGDMIPRSPFSRFLITFVGGTFSWQSKLQKCVALSIT